jgi:hypothetical protein
MYLLRKKLVYHDTHPSREEGGGGGITTSLNIVKIPAPHKTLIPRNWKVNIRIEKLRNY